MGAGKYLLILFLFFFLKAAPQQLQHHVTVDLHDKPISEILREITRQTGIEFSYDPRQIPVDKIVTVTVRNQEVREILEELLVTNGIGYLLVEKHIVLKLREPAQGQNSNIKPSLPSRYTISGFIRERSAGEALIGANIHARGTPAGATTNGYGFFSLTLPAGIYVLVFSYMGYQEQIREINLEENKRILLELEEQPLPISEVEIIGTGDKTEINQDQMSNISFTPKTLTSLPGFGGNLDI
ncbi:MAG: carboxypeptidase-like regulatory domain-containing protein, partial [Bacteroidota bacterium]